MSAIPKQLLQKARSLSIRHRFREENVIFQSSSLLTIDLFKMKSRDYFWLYINAATVKASGLKLCGKELNVENIKWKSKFDLIGKVCRENKLIDFQFKPITEEENVNKCLHCREHDSITHIFVNCPFSQIFFSGVLMRNIAVPVLQIH